MASRRSHAALDKQADWALDCGRQGFDKNLTPQSAYGRKSYRI